MGCFWSEEKRLKIEVEELKECVTSQRAQHEAAMKERERELKRSAEEREADKRKFEKKFDDLTKENLGVCRQYPCGVPLLHTHVPSSSHYCAVCSELNMGCFWSEQAKLKEKIESLNETIETLNQRHDAAIKERERELERARNERLADQRKYQKRIDELTKLSEIESSRTRSEYQEKLREKERVVKTLQQDIEAGREEERQKMERLRREDRDFMDSLTETFQKKLDDKDELLKEAREEILLAHNQCEERVEEIAEELRIVIEKMREGYHNESKANDEILLDSVERLWDFYTEMSEHEIRKIERRRKRSSVYEPPVPTRRGSAAPRFASPDEATIEIEETCYENISIEEAI